VPVAGPNCRTCEKAGAPAKNTAIESEKAAAIFMIVFLKMKRRVDLPLRPQPRCRKELPVFRSSEQRSMLAVIAARGMPSRPCTPAHNLRSFARKKRASLTRRATEEHACRDV
jgi:hypothetical protein